MKFYNDIAEYYHLIFEDWDRSIEKQANGLSIIIQNNFTNIDRIHDASCGIGTQVIGLSKKGRFYKH
jgi:glycine/sarcosine N-methyltransferase